MNSSPGTDSPSVSPSVLLTGTSSDAHTWNLVYLQLVLEEVGHTVANLGPCAPDELVVRSCLELRPRLVVVSSVNGHGFNDGLRLIRELRARPELASATVVIGGKLGTDGLRNVGMIRRLTAAGYDRVFDDGELPAFRSLAARSVYRAVS
ncbi:cobalamin B12-binding domain-containing protein [Streptomyces sp. 1331.2]|uniref:cobalamin B12-binding domain-containing protein n=1 Tax=Streptomyces sp. 1331.2 TaxID=1938835 RepID=UPI000BDCFF84|nr:cobalamin-dependent protein [Streptomyces sp. 1331.2]SOB81292.1 glutamate mutase subunit S [Streptomyces sp. 1331.2]